VTDRYEVHVTDTFFEELDRQPPAERGPIGQPSATDLIVIDLPAIVEQFATPLTFLVGPWVILGSGSLVVLVLLMAPCHFDGLGGVAAGMVGCVKPLMGTCA